MNVPEVELPVPDGWHRVLHFHRNRPGVLQNINSLFAERNVNVLGQYLMTNPEIGYLVMDIAKGVNKKMLSELREMPDTIRARILF